MIRNKTKIRKQIIKRHRRKRIRDKKDQKGEKKQETNDETNRMCDDEEQKTFIKVKRKRKKIRNKEVLIGSTSRSGTD